jgi:hypothetical protein
MRAHAAPMFIRRASRVGACAARRSSPSWRNGSPGPGLRLDVVPPRAEVRRALPPAPRAPHEAEFETQSPDRPDASHRVSRPAPAVATRAVRRAASGRSPARIRLVRSRVLSFISTFSRRQTHRYVRSNGSAGSSWYHRASTSRERFSETAVAAYGDAPVVMSTDRT